MTAAGAEAVTRIQIARRGWIARIIVEQIGEPQLFAGAAFFNHFTVGTVVTAARALRIIAPETAAEIGLYRGVFRSPETDCVRRNKAGARRTQRLRAGGIGEEQLQIGKIGGVDAELILLE